jgi:hypothetical protein
MDYTGNMIAFHLKIDTAVKNIMKDGKIDQNDIPTLVLLISEIICSQKLVEKELRDTINELYNYIMCHYKLFPEDEQQKAAFKTVFDMCIKLVFFQPNILQIKPSRLFSCFN